MLPSVRPVIRSMSSGVSTCRCRIRSRMLGKRSSSVEITVSPKASRSASSHVRPSERWYGAYCTKHDITCFVQYAPYHLSDGHWDDLSLIHISEPTRLLSISYAVFCLKK